MRHITRVFSVALIGLNLVLVWVHSSCELLLAAFSGGNLCRPHLYGSADKQRKRGLQGPVDCASIQSMNSDDSKSCYQKALQLLARRDHSSAELERKLRARGYGQSQIQTAIRECLRLNYLNDNRFAETYSLQLQRKGFGINGIKHKLYVRGISDSVIQDIVAAHGSDTAQLVLCRRVLAKKLKPLAGTADVKIQDPKLLRFLYNRGFSSHIIRKTIDEAVTGNDATAE